MIDSPQFAIGQKLFAIIFCSFGGATKPPYGTYRLTPCCVIQDEHFQGLQKNIYCVQCDDVCNTYHGVESDKLFLTYETAQQEQARRNALTYD